MLNFLFVDKRELFVMKLSFEELCYYQQVLILPSELKSYRAFRETGLAGKLFYVLFVWSAFRIKVSIILKMIKCKIDWFASKEWPYKGLPRNGWWGERIEKKLCERLGTSLDLKPEVGKKRLKGP